MNYNKYLILTLCCILFIVIKITGQNETYPPSDSRFTLETTLSDEFNSFDATKWSRMSGNWWGDWNFITSLANVSGNELVLEMNGTTQQSSAIWSVGFSYNFGYYEIRAILPAYNDASGNRTGLGLWPCFWTFFVAPGHSGCRTIHDEIDILEPSGWTYRNLNTNGVSLWDDIGSCNIRQFGVGEINYGVDLSVNYHTYGCLWLPDRVYYYFDGEIVFSYAGPEVPDGVNDQRVVMSMQAGGGSTLPAGTTLVQNYQIEYFRYYSITPSAYECVDLVIDSNYQLNNYSDALSNTLTIGKNDGSSNLTLTNSNTFTAKNIVINRGFTIDSGTTCEFITTPNGCF